ncbi:MAG TPA: 3-deoxy-7-phosphoheptulonate synthase [Candidatus Limivivens intestinipullorum]|uniref:Phospho-2-dehydro-3-deoxyheptonate aldolase n=1 Tax=Candidatus Limivivens intestinipullorum TaxID=2840858 RepID=A0A9D1ESY6_9FIRM|nr:3-deoxy-7-phosphoheptulonate synthase [Candidatus Limivivens intestinipullorum]
MGFNFITKLPTPEEIRKQYPVSEKVARIKEERDALIKKVFTGESDKFLVIIGPCSADNADAVCEYLGRLAKVQDQVGDRLILIPRIYTNKPRTTGEGYKGLLHQPDPEKKPDVLAGLIAIRKLHLRAIEESGLTAADEMLYPENWRYLSDILSYVAIGARSVENQQHRLVVSGMDVPAGMKNPTSGDLSVMLNSIYAAQHAHNFIYRNWEVETTGNPLTHAVLRGAVNKHGNSIPNYHYEDLELLLEKYQERNLQNPAVIVDANHSNSNKQYKEQIRIVKEVLHSRNVNEGLKKLVKGVMIESYLVPGCQKIGQEPHVYGKSITDPCLGWEDSEKLVHTIYKMCQER